MAKKKVNTHQKDKNKSAPELTPEEKKKNRIKAYVGVAVAVIIFTSIIIAVFLSQSSGIDYQNILPGTWEADDALGAHVVLEINDDLSATYTARGYTYKCNCSTIDESNAVKVEVTYEDSDKNSKEYLLYKYNDEYILGFDVSSDENAFHKTSK